MSQSRRTAMRFTPEMTGNPSGLFPSGSGYRVPGEVDSVRILGRTVKMDTWQTDEPSTTWYSLLRRWTLGEASLNAALSLSDRNQFLAAGGLGHPYDTPHYASLPPPLPPSKMEHSDTPRYPHLGGEDQGNGTNGRVPAVRADRGQYEGIGASELHQELRAVDEKYRTDNPERGILLAHMRERARRVNAWQKVIRAQRVDRFKPRCA